MAYPNTLTMDTKIVRTRQVRDSLNIRVGDLENSQLTNAGINELERKTGGALNILLLRLTVALLNMPKAAPLA